MSAPATGRSYAYEGRSFAVLTAHPATVEGARSTNEYLIAHPQARVLVITDDEIIVVHKRDEGVPIPGL